MSLLKEIILILHLVNFLSAGNFDYPEWYEKYKTLQTRDVVVCLHDYGGRIRWWGGDRVVDLGCGGGGTTANVLRTRLPSDFAQLVGCDVSARMVHHAHAHYADARTTFRQLDLAAPLPNDMKGSFDHAFSFHAMHWILDQRSAFANIYEMLAEGGDCLLLFMAHMSCIDGIRLVTTQLPWRAYAMDVRERGFFVYHDLQRPEEEVWRLMKSSGFNDIIVERRIMNYTYETRDQYTGAVLAINPFDIPGELTEDYLCAIEQAIRHLRLPSCRLEENVDPWRRRLFMEYSVIIASGRK